MTLIQSHCTNRPNIDSLCRQKAIREGRALTLFIAAAEYRACTSNLTVKKEEGYRLGSNAVLQLLTSLCDRLETMIEVKETSLNYHLFSGVLQHFLTLYTIDSYFITLYRIPVIGTNESVKSKRLPHSD